MKLLLESRRFQWVIEVGFWLIYLGTNAIVSSFSVITEYARTNRVLEDWEPFTWELSSAVVVGMLIFAVAQFNKAVRFTSESWRLPLALHLIATIPFSLMHVGGMVAIRKMTYSLFGRGYDFGLLSVELPYEFRKDFYTYWLIIAVIYLWQYIRFINTARPDPSERSNKPLRRFLVKKLGQEYFIDTVGIDWIEAAGNSALLHHKDGVYPVRASMNELARQLDEAQFARVHRSFIVNLDQAGEIEPTEGGDYLINMQDGSTVRFSRRYRTKLKGRLTF